MGFVSIVEYSRIGWDNDKRISMPMPAEPAVYRHPPLEIGTEASVSEQFHAGTKFISVAVFDERCCIAVGGDAVAGCDVVSPGERLFFEVAPGQRLSVIAY